MQTRPGLRTARAAYLACCTGHLSGLPRNTCRMTLGLMKSTRLTRALGT